MLSYTIFFTDNIEIEYSYGIYFNKKILKYGRYSQSVIDLECDGFNDCIFFCMKEDQ